MISEEPYLDLTCYCKPQEIGKSFEGSAQVSHGCCQLESWDVRLSPLSSATPIVSCITLAKLPGQPGGGWGWRQVSVALISRATQALQWSVQRVLQLSDKKLIPKSRPQFGLESATRLHEVGIASNRWSAIQRWIRSRVLHTPPVNWGKLEIPEVSLYWGPKVESMTNNKS